MGRINVLAYAVATLLCTNALLWAGEARHWAGQDGRLPEPCMGKQSQPASKSAMFDTLRELGEDGDPPTPPPTSPCSGCTQIMATTQVWCKYRPPNTECFAGPAYDNFRWERPLKIYSCANGQRGICCGQWIQDGCCNDSGSEPPCWDPDVHFVCTEGPNCP